MDLCLVEEKATFGQKCVTSLPCYKRLDLWHLVCVFQIIKDIDNACYGAVYIVRCTTLPYFDLPLPLLRTLPS